ncbi:MAG: FAD-dependent oxidoreductase [Gemmatimonadetes bacterium]|nr:FAD-dependent oxidoreductase [Gemmatimonadota bacterium]
MAEREYDFIAVGGGTAGLVSAVGARIFGARVALVEREALGGDCLWTGCVPSKALIASARLAHRMRHAERLGLRGAAPAHAFREVMLRMRAVRERVSEHDDPERFRRMGIDVLEGVARFAGRGRIEVDGVGALRSRRIVIATGSVPAAPPIPGLEEAGYLTHRTAFDQDALAPSITIVGGGPIGLEFAQVYARLGSRVTIVELLPRLLPREDPDVAEVVHSAFVAEGIAVETGVQVIRVERQHAEKVVVAEDGRRFAAAELFVATGRRPETASLALERAGIEAERSAVQVNDRLETSARGVWAAGDVTGGLQFTHVADYMAKVVVQNALFPLRKRADYSKVPWVTYTDPEVAHVGLSQEEAESRGATTHRYPFADLDRAIVDAETAGYVKISARRGHILGATVVGPTAGELLMPLVLAMQHGIRLPSLSATIFPYPTLVEGVKRTADAFQRARLEGAAAKLLKRVVRWRL